MTRLLILATALSATLASAVARAELLAQDEFLAPGQAYQLSAQQGEQGWSLAIRILPDYYLYVDKLVAFSAADGIETALALETGNYRDYPDPLFGSVKIYQGDLSLALRDNPLPGELWVKVQGCSMRGLCYPPEQRLLSIIPD